MTRALCATLLTAACGTPPHAPLADAAPITLELGQGLDDYAALRDGGAALVYMGPQGGFHVYLSLRARNVAAGDPDEAPTVCGTPGALQNPCVDFVVVDVATGRTIDLYVPLRLPLVLEGDGRVGLVRGRLVQLDVPSLAAAVGKILAVRATVSDPNGRTGSAGLTVIAAAAPVADAGADAAATSRDAASPP